MGPLPRDNGGGGAKDTPKPSEPCPDQGPRERLGTRGERGSGIRCEWDGVATPTSSQDLVPVWARGWVQVRVPKCYEQNCVPRIHMSKP